ncbi:MAG: homoserine dehydrogenase [Candidatus Levybacteria bacterium]|nr:homoserine dehydrogenase [Candidatus Levybacteria bacterium]
MEAKQVNIGLIGFGNIGRGIVKYFNDGKGKQFNVHLKKVLVSNPLKKRDPQYSAVTTNPKEIFDDPQIDIVVEVMGGVDTAKKYILEALKNKKNVVTANKAVMSRFAKELFDTARKKSLDIGFEAAVGGGIPIIRTINGYKGEKITKIMAILNGTTNFILSQMEKGLSFEEALKIAQEKGFAEANHILDTGGFDTRDKLALLASLIFNTQIDINKISCAGITEITPIDIDFANKYNTEDGGWGYAIKLLAVAKKHNGTIELRVNPALISKNHPLASIHDEFNAVYIEGELCGPQMFWGKGAGTNPTTSAVISDILRIAKNIQNGTSDELPSLDSKVKYVDPQDIVQKGYIRVSLKHIPGSLYKISGFLAQSKLNIEDSIQRKNFEFDCGNKKCIPDIITIQSAKQKTINTALKNIQKSNRVFGKPFFLNFEE